MLVQINLLSLSLLSTLHPPCFDSLFSWPCLFVRFMHLGFAFKQLLLVVVTENQAAFFVQNNQLDASNIQNLFCHKTVHFSGIFCTHHQELSAVRTAIGTFHAGYVTAS